MLLPIDLPYAPTLTTLDRVKSRSDITSTNTNDDAIIMRIIRECSAYLQQYALRTFVPYAQEKLYFYAELTSALELDTKDDLLAITELDDTTGDEIVSADYVLTPLNTYPKRYVRLANSAFSAPSGLIGQIAVSGIWGYTRRYPECWKASGAVIPAGNLTNSASSVTLASGGASFAVLDYIKVGSEVMQVTARAGEVLTLSRGELGTTPAAHTSGAAIAIYQQLPDVEKAAVDLTLWAYRLRNSNESTVSLAGGVSIQFDSAPSSILATMNSYRRSEYYAVGGD